MSVLKIAENYRWADKRLSWDQAKTLAEWKLSQQTTQDWVKAFRAYWSY
jgi:hypothetical protein